MLDPVPLLSALPKLLPLEPIYSPPALPPLLPAPRTAVWVLGLSPMILSISLNIKVRIALEVGECESPRAHVREAGRAVPDGDIGPPERARAVKA